MDELIQLVKNLSSEITSLRKEVSSLKYEVQCQKINRTWMDMKEAAEYLHVSISTMKNRLTEGAFPFAVKKGRKWMFPAEKIKKYASNNVVS